jgi:predicted metalloprotease with PDZ domain
MRLARSKVIRLTQFLFILGFLVFPASNDICGQTPTVRIVVSSAPPARAMVEAQGPETDTWSFRNIYAGIGNLGARVENFKVHAEGQSVTVRNLAPGEFRSSKEVSSFSYEIVLEERSRAAELSHVSWINRERGFLMLADLLPRFGRETLTPSKLSLNLQLPAGWSVASAHLPDSNRQYSVTDIDNAVFYIGRELRETAKRIDSMELGLVTSGDWPFSDDDALKIAARIVKEHSKLTQYRLKRRAVIFLAPLSGPEVSERWTAETRGASVVLLMGRNAGQKALLRRLGVVLAHELFHLWVPNALALKGEYDWFFEGFTLYQALLTSVRLNLIKFDDYLDTMARVYDSYRSLPDHDKLSLIEASERRWTAAPSFVYDKGMLVAFIHDLKLRQSSRNETSADIYPELFRTAVTPSRDANEVIMSVLNRPPGMSQFFEDYVQNGGDIQLDAILAQYGLQVETKDFRSRIVIKTDLSAEQRLLLRSIGYRG